MKWGIIKAGIGTYHRQHGIEDFETPLIKQLFYYKAIMCMLFMVNIRVYCRFGCQSSHHLYTFWSPLLSIKKRAPCSDPAWTLIKVYELTLTLNGNTIKIFTFTSLDFSPKVCPSSSSSLLVEKLWVTSFRFTCLRCVRACAGTQRCK